MPKDAAPCSASKSPSTNAAETLLFHCPGCGIAHALPPAAIGRRARCSGCRKVFVVASDLLRPQAKPTNSKPQPKPERGARPEPVLDDDDAFGDFLNEIVEEHFEDEEVDAARAAGIGSADEPAAKLSAAPKKAEPRIEPELASAPEPKARPEPQAQPQLQAHPKAESRPDTSSDAPPSAAAASPAQASPRRAGRHAFLEPASPRPFLSVRQVCVTGVTLAFRETWLNHARFRLSFPRRCAFSGETQKLIARPMVFINQHGSGDEEARNVEMKYEHQMTAASELETVAAAIDRIEGLAAPFDLPLLYFATADYYDAALACVATRNADDWGFCEVTLPSAEVALEWIARVNGICDPGYADLAGAVDRLSAAAWNRLPAQTRSRITAWCRFNAGEDFLAYSRDATLTASDTGLAGLVLTSDRLISRRGRKTEAVRLDSLTHAAAVPTPGGFRLTVRTDAGQDIELSPMPRGEAPLLLDALETTAPQLQIEALAPVD